MKGVSQVVTSTLILAVAVAVAGVYANWAPEFSGQIVGDIAEQREQEMSCDNAAVQIDRAYYDLSGNFTEVQVSNTGTISLQQGLNVASLQDASILNRSTVNRLEVDESAAVELESDQSPDRVIVTSEDCPSMDVFTERIPEQ